MALSCFKKIRVEPEELKRLVREIVPKLTNKKHKGQYGRIGVVGGSLEYTGAPYFAAISALRVGSDLAHIFCQRDAATVIKSYSPELIVHPILDSIDPINQIQPWIERLHVMIIGPGLGRDTKIQRTATEIIKLCIEVGKPLIIDADGLVLLQNNLEIIKESKHVILTPNAIEFERLFGATPELKEEKFKLLGNGVVVLEKGYEDIIYDNDSKNTYYLPSGGTGRRCGGQGDILCGTLATFFHWSLQSNKINPEIIAIFGASLLTKYCNGYAFKLFGRSMLAGDMINEVHNVFSDFFEQKDE